MAARADSGGLASEGAIVFGNLLHSGLGRAQFDSDARGLVVTNLGAGGQDGVEIALQELSRTMTLQLEPVRLVGGDARRLRVSADGMVHDLPDRPLASLILVGRPNGIGAGVSNNLAGWLGRLRWEIFRGGTRVSQFELAATDAISLATTDAQVSRITVGSSAGPGNEGALWEVEFTGSFTTSAGGGPGLTGDRLRIVPLNVSGPLQNLARVALMGSNLGVVRIREEDAPRFQPQLRIERSEPHLRLSWDTRSARLERASALRGPWVTIATETNRADVAGDGAAAFFRVLTNPFEPCRLKPIPALGYECKRNVLFVIVDDVGVDQLPIYTNYYNSNAAAADDIIVKSTALNPFVVLPTVERLAASGVTFLNAWSSPTCSPSRAGFFTGTCSFRHGVYSPAAPKLATDATTLAAVLGASGYVNGLFGKWHLGASLSQLPSAFGWNRFEGASGGDLPDFYDWIKDITTLSGGLPIWAQASITNYATLENASNALAWIPAQTAPWMATVSFNAPHWANKGAGNYYQNPPAGFSYQSHTSNNKGKYRAMLECADLSLSNLLAGLSADMLERTTIVFIGDNGTEATIGDHFASGHDKSSLYEGGVNVPLIIADGYTYLHGQASPWVKGLGRVVAPGRFETNLVQTMDIFATAAEIGRADGSCGVDSVSMVPYLSSASAAPQRQVSFAETYANGQWNVAVRDQTHKLIVNDYCGSTPTYELYDLSADRWEKTLIPEDGTSAIATALLAQLATLVAVPSACPVTPQYAVPTICP